MHVQLILSAFVDTTVQKASITEKIVLFHQFVNTETSLNSLKISICRFVFTVIDLIHK